MQNDPIRATAEGLPEMNRRRFLRGAAIVSAGVAITPFAEGTAAERVPMESPLFDGPAAASPVEDCIFAAIGKHKACRDRLRATHSTDEAFEAAADAEREAWEALCFMSPDTLEGLAAYSGHICNHPDLPYMAASDGAIEALRSVAVTAARLAYRARA